MSEPVHVPLRVLVVDDELHAREALAKLLERDADVTLAGLAADGAAALEHVLREAPDLILLDVQMPGLDGFEFLEELRTLKPERELPLVVFITAFDRYALRAFEVHAVDYLLKPFGDTRFFEALARAKQRLSGELRAAQGESLERLLAERRGGETHDERLLVKTKDGVVLLAPEEILYFESSDHYVFVHTTAGTHLTRESLAHLEAVLDPRHFVRIHRSALVHLAQVERLEGTDREDCSLLLRGGVRLRVSRRRLAEVRRMLGA